MNAIARYPRELISGAVGGWNRFWFTPSDPTTLCVLRILAGAMLLYTHVVWTIDLPSFFGEKGWVSPEALSMAKPPAAQIGVWSHWYLIHSPGAMWAAHAVAIVLLLMFTLGLFTRVTSVLAYLITVSYANRLIPQALFGLDDINVMLAMYLMLGPCGAKYSIDAWLRGRAGGRGAEGEWKANDRGAPTVAANFVVRLIQVHMCVIYLFSAAGKMMGGSWWAGDAIWGAAANLEYQSLDLTWLAHWPLLINLLTHATVFWELSYAVLVWPRLTRPLVLAMAVLVHGGIALFMGMQTFGYVMLIGNFAFVEPLFLRSLIERRQSTGAGQGGAAAPAAETQNGMSNKGGRKALSR